MKRVSMRKVKEILRLTLHAGFSQENAAKTCGSSKGFVWKVLRKAREAGLVTWPDVEHHTEEELETKLYGAPPERRSGKVLPDWEWVHQELRHKHVTRVLLWEEYREQKGEADTLGLSQFCESYARWRKSIDLVMRQSHKPGERVFTDFAGPTVRIDAPDGAFEAHLFLAVMGMSNFTFACAFADEKRKSWLDGHALAFEYFGGVPELLVPDNPRALIDKAHRYEPDVNPEFVEFSRHYDTAVMPARVARPKDKAKVEAGVLLAERWILAALRHRVFCSLAELNDAVELLLEKLNNRRFKKLPGTRAEMFAKHEAALLAPLPASRFQVPRWKNATVAPDYHVEIEGHYYSVPFEHRGKKARVRYTDTTVEIFLRDERVAAHARSHAQGGHTWIKEHLPRAHREYIDWSPEDLKGWAASIGPSTHALVARVMEARPHPVLGFRSAFGILGLSKKRDPKLLESACERCLAFHGYSYRAVARMLTALEKQGAQPARRANSAASHEMHSNIRGAGAFTDDEPPVH